LHAVVLACRDEKRGEQLKESLEQNAREHGNTNPQAEVMLLDVSSLQSVRSFAQRWSQRQQPLHCLINNAGIFDIGGSKPLCNSSLLAVQATVLARHISTPRLPLIQAIVRPTCLDADVHQQSCTVLHIVALQFYTLHSILDVRDMTSHAAQVLPGPCREPLGMEMIFHVIQDHKNQLAAQLPLPRAMSLEHGHQA